LRNFKKFKLFGFNFFFFFNVKKRLESTSFNLKEQKLYIFLYHNIFDFFKIFDFKFYYFLSLLFLQLIFCYRGFRFLFNLPVNGQRTWSNGKSTYFVNKIFFVFRYNFFKNKFINLKYNEFYSFFYIEYINIFWKVFFFNEWFFIYLKNLRNEKKFKNNDFQKNKFKFLNKDILFLNLINLKKMNVSLKKNSDLDYNNIGFLPGKYRNIIFF